MINLNQIRFNILKFSLILIIFSLYSQILFSSENKIIFKINNKAFTTLDYQKRRQYLEFVGNNSGLSKDFIISDFISANLFFEYYINSNLKLNLEEVQIFENIKVANKQNKREFNFELNKNEILLNIKIDLVRKVILENAINSNSKDLNVEVEDIDLLYKFKVNYINFDALDAKNIVNEINNLKNIDLKQIKLFLNNKKITFFEKKQEINNIEKIDKRIKDNILSKNNFFIFENNNKVSIVFVEKRFETFDGINANIYSVRSKLNLSDTDLKCNNLKKLSNKADIENKEYKFLDLNDEIKTKLISINDYIKFKNNEENIYVILCNITFDKKILNNLNLNKLINLNVDEIEKNFIKKYSKIYNLIIIND